MHFKYTAVFNTNVKSFIVQVKESVSQHSLRKLGLWYFIVENVSTWLNGMKFNFFSHIQNILVTETGTVQYTQLSLLGWKISIRIISIDEFFQHSLVQS
jgi:hypothetical protein